MSKKEFSLRRACRPLELLLIAAVIAIFLTVLLEVVSRYLLHQSIAWSSEVCQTLLVWITFIGGAVALVGGEHMQIDAALNRISAPCLKKAVLLVGYAAVLFFLLCGLWGGIKLVDKTWSMTTTTLQLPAGVLYLAFPVGCLLMIIATVRNIYFVLHGKEHH